MLDTTTYPVFTVLPSHEQRVVFTGREAPAKPLMAAVTNTGWNKPGGGLWTCPAGSEGWLAWCEREDFDNPETMQQHTLQIRQPIQLAVIDTLADLEAVLDAHYVPSLFGMGPTIDFETLAQEVDGIWLTDRGQWATRMSRPASLYGWDLETILFFRWVF